MHILLVEDNEADIFLATETLEEVDMITKFSVVRDGKEAIDFLNKAGKYNNSELPDLVLLDINLPRKNGHEVLKYIKAEKNFQHIPVIMLSTSSFEKDIKLSYDNAASDYLTKPLEISDFMKAVSKIQAA